MSKEKTNNGFKIGDIVKHIKTGIQGRIHEFEWSGVRRACISTPDNKGYYIISVEELEMVSRPESGEKSKRD